MSGLEANVVETRRLLREVAEGDPLAEDRLFPLLYEELRERARRLMRGQRSGHTLQTTALVHEAWMRIARGGEIDTKSRARYLAVAAKAMRTILVDHARARNSDKRGGGQPAVSLQGEGLPITGASETMLALDEALDRLEALDPELRQVAELRLFSGLAHADVAMLSGVSERTVERQWRSARAWLQRELEAQP